MPGRRPGAVSIEMVVFSGYPGVTVMKKSSWWPMVKTARSDEVISGAARAWVTSTVTEDDVEAASVSLPS